MRLDIFKNKKLAAYRKLLLRQSAERKKIKIYLSINLNTTEYNGAKEKLNWIIINSYLLPTSHKCENKYCVWLWAQWSNHFLAHFCATLIFFFFVAAAAFAAAYRFALHRFLCIFNFFFPNESQRHSSCVNDEEIEPTKHLRDMMCNVYAARVANNIRTMFSLSLSLHGKKVHTQLIVYRARACVWVCVYEITAFRMNRVRRTQTQQPFYRL